MNDDVIVMIILIFFQGVSVCLLVFRFVHGDHTLITKHCALVEAGHNVSISTM